MRRALETVALVLALCGCVGSQPEDVQGSVTFVTGLPNTSPDYTVLPNVTMDPPGTGVTSLGPGGQLPAAGTGPSVPPFGAAGAEAPPPVSIAGMGGTAGTGAGSIDTGGTTTTAGTGGDSAGSGEAGSGSEPMPSGAPGTLTVAITTVAAGGRYRPRNYGAVWIETASGQFVKTIERWAGIHVADLRRWNQASGGWGFSFFGTTSSPDQVDAVSGATARSHVAHSSTWVGKDVMGGVVPDGQYKVVFELADGTTASAEVMFTKGPMPQTVSAPAGGAGYSSFTVTYTP